MDWIDITENQIKDYKILDVSFSFKYNHNIVLS